MKSLWNSFKIAFAMFSKIPMPQADWSEENMRYMLCFFPFVGAAVGVVMLGVEWLCRYFGMSNGFIAVALVLVPVIVTGGIHVDGLLDTSDALSSWRDREKTSGDSERFSCRCVCGHYSMCILFDYVWRNESDCGTG